MIFLLSLVAARIASMGVKFSSSTKCTMSRAFVPIGIQTKP
jgi:hypothetical protein